MYMYIYVCVCVCVYVYIVILMSWGTGGTRPCKAYIYTYAHTHTHIYIYIYTNIYTYIYLQLYQRLVYICPCFHYTIITLSVFSIIQSVLGFFWRFLFTEEKKTDSVMELFTDAPGELWGHKWTACVYIHVHRYICFYTYIYT